jgi:hypothetical protein
MNNVNGTIGMEHAITDIIGMGLGAGDNPSRRRTTTITQLMIILFSYSYEQIDGNNVDNGIILPHGFGSGRHSSPWVWQW